MSISHKCFVWGVTLLLVLFVGGFTMFGQSVPCPGPVENEDTGKCYISIQAAINDAATQNGHRIKVYSTYNNQECITVWKSLKISGEHWLFTKIQASCVKPEAVVTITANNVEIKNFNILGNENINWTYPGIKVKSNNNVIDLTLIEKCHKGIYLDGVSGNVVSNNYIYLNTTGADEGIVLNSSTENVIDRNGVLDFNYIGRSISLLSSSHNIISSNCLDDSYNGIYMENSEENHILGNIIENNVNGIWIKNSTGNNILANNFEYNANGIYLFTSSNANTFYYNNFINNYEQVSINTDDIQYTGNQWDNGFPAGGNFWDDHPCVDSNADGICDNPYEIPDGAGDQDLYPLTSQWTRVSGNVNGDRDGDINILDIDYLIAYLYHGGPPPIPLCAADANCDGNINILDVTYLINFLYKEGPEPVDCPCTCGGF